MEKAKKKKYAVVFRCAVPKCTYASQRYYNLQRHKKVHEKMRWRSKRFPCPCCAYAGTTRAHLRRHMGIKHPTVEINPGDLKALSFEYFADEEREEEEEEEELKQNEQMEHEKELEEDEEQKEELQLEHLEPQQKSLQLLINGPVTVLEMVTPRSRESSQLMPGEIYSEYTLEGEAFRLIPVALLPPEVAAKDL